MANLNLWQKPSRVLGGDWGDGKDGAATVSSDPNTRATITATATQSTGTAGSSAFANGDLVLLHQTQGTGAGQWEINRVSSGGGSTSLTFQVAHQYTYSTGAQIIKVPRYTTATVSAHSVTAWNGTTGGVEVICGKTSITVSGALNGAGLGFRGGALGTNNAVPANQGESTIGTGTTSTNANGSGGGGGKEGHGGGGGHAGGGTDGVAGSPAGTGGGTNATADGTKVEFGGGGGGSVHGVAGYASNGGPGGAVFILISKSVILSAGVNANGANCGASSDRYGGSGAGGFNLIVCETATLGTNQATATGATLGADGGVGAIAVHHSGTVTGTTNPTFTDVTDATLHDIVLSNNGRFYFM